MSEILRRKEILLLISGITAGVMFFDYFFIEPVVQSTATILRSWCVIIFSFALGLGLFAALRVHLSRISRRQKGLWPMSIWLIVFTAIMVIAGLTVTPMGATVGLYGWLFEYWWVPLTSAAYAITGFYIFSACYRAFKARNIDAAILIIAGVFVMLTNAPVGASIWSGIPVIGRWILDIGQIPAMRTISFTGGLGLILFGFRTLLGWERGTLGEE